MALLFNETESVRANNLPLIAAPSFAVMADEAMMFPLNVELDPRVAEVPTCKKCCTTEHC